MRSQPLIGAAVSDLVQPEQKIAISIELACRSKLLHHVVGVDGVNVHAPEAAVVDPAFVDELG